MRLTNSRIHHFRRQRGVVLFISLIMLVAMTMAGIALVRSVDTTNLIAGNLAFKQGTTLAADPSLEQARNWLINQPAGNLWIDVPGGNKAYYASTVQSALTPAVAGKETPWPQFDWTNFSIAVAADAAGNQVNYVMQRICKATGNPAVLPASSCVSTSGECTTCSKDVSKPSESGPTQYYYRITARVTGPRNTVSYVQTIIQI